MELNNFMDDIIELRKFHNKENLENIIIKKIPNIKKPVVFNIKMEIKRLSNMCSKTLDLRYVNETAAYTPFEHEGMLHYLDEKSLEIFKRELRIYENVYTEGVHDIVLREAKERAEIEKDKKYLNVLDFSDVKTRKEERMNYTVMLNLYPLKDQTTKELLNFINGNKENYTKFPCVSINISESGIQIKTKSEVNYNEDDVIFIEFDKKKLLYNDNTYHVPYQVKGKQVEKGFIYYSLGRVTSDKIRNNDFENSLKVFIKENKEKYKIELSNIVNSARLKTYEQAYMQNMRSLPLYFNGKNLEYAFLSNKENNLINYFENEEYENVLSNILNTLDVNKEIRRDKTKIYFMTFKIEKHDKVHFFAKKLDLKQEKMLKLFSIYGSKRNNFKIFKLDIIDIKKEEYISKTALPKESMKNVNYSNHLITRGAEEKLKNINRLGLLTDLTREEYKLRLSNIQSEDKDFNKLKKFQVSTKIIKQFEIVEDESFELRRDDRFIIKEDVNFKYQEKKYTGKTNNVSINGLQLIVDRYLVAPEGDVLMLNFNNLESQGLISVKYRIVKRTGQVVSLKLLPEDNYKIVQDYFRNYISQRINAIKPIGLKSNYIGLAKGLRNIYINNHLETPCLFTITKDNNIRKYDIIVSKQTQQLFDSIKNENVSKMLHSSKLKEYLIKKYTEMAEKKSKSINVFIKMLNGKEVVKFEEEFLDEKSKLSFLADEQYPSFCFNVLMTKSCKRFNDKYFKDELEYIEKYSDIKASCVKNEENIISGILKIQNISEIKIQKLELILK